VCAANIIRALHNLKSQTRMALS